jgi:nucleotide-binding universal stress UspA family protein
MRAGRPVLIVPAGAKTIDLEDVVVGWRDRRETRCAVADALPLLRLAERVTVVEIEADAELTEARARLDDVVAWLGRHGVAAKALAAPASGVDVVMLEATAREQHAGLLVAGAYGHSRLLEWVFGGVTCDLLLHPGLCTLLSH